MKTKLSSFDQIFTVMHTVPLFCHIVNLSVQYTHTTTFNNFEQRRFLFIRRFNWKWNTSATPLIYLLVILEYVLISLMPHSELCRRDQIPPTHRCTQNWANRNQVSVCQSRWHLSNLGCNDGIFMALTPFIAPHIFEDSWKFDAKWIALSDPLGVDLWEAIKFSTNGEAGRSGERLIFLIAMHFPDKFVFVKEELIIAMHCT